MMPRDNRDADDVLNPNVDGVGVFVDDRCANCLEWLPKDTDGLFCSDWCSEVCKHVRYFRGVFADGRIADSEVQAAVGTRLAFLPVGGYKSLGRVIGPQVRVAVVERDGGVCQVCGNPGTDIDHILGSSPDPSNLQLLCTDCHQTKTQANMVPASEATKTLIDTLFDERVFPDDPKLLADSTEWHTAWRPLKKARKQRLLDELANLDVDITGVTTRSDLVLLRDDAIFDDGYNEDEEWDPETASSDDSGYGANSSFARAMERDD